MLDIQKLIGAPKIVVNEISSNTAQFAVHHLPR